VSRNFYQLSFNVRRLFVSCVNMLANLSFVLLIACTISSGGWIIFMELYPGFALYRGLYEFSQSSFTGDTMGTHGMRWEDLNDSTNGMKEVLIIMFLEWLLVLFFAYYIDQVLSTGSWKSPLLFLKGFQKKRSSSFRKPSLQRQGSKVFVMTEKADIHQEVSFACIVYVFCVSTCLRNQET